MRPKGPYREIVIGILLLLVFSLVLPLETRAGTISEAKVRQSLVDYLEGQAPAGTELIQWELGRGDSLPPRGEIISVEKAPGTTWQSDMSIRILISSGEREARPYWVTARLSYNRRVLVACRNLPLGHLISRGDVRLETQQGRNGSKDTFTRFEDVVGRTVWRPVSKGTLIKKWHVKESEKIRNGDVVAIIARKGGLTVQAPGQVLEPGVPGDTVRVLNTATGKEIYARVVDPKTVAVSF